MTPKRETETLLVSTENRLCANRVFYGSDAPDEAGSTAFEIGITVHRPTGTGNDCAIFYFHGGAFVCGWRDDLPQIYIDMICNAGYTLVCIDYPLAPECAMPGAIVVSEQVLLQLIAERKERFCCSTYALFGRSAGAYLSLILAARIAAHTSIPQPLAIWDFYGYWNHADPFFLKTSKYYAGLAPIGEALAKAQLVDPAHPLTNAEAHIQRVLLYAYGRQTNTWPAMLGITEATAIDFSLTEADIARLPPLFITASTGDEDVPLRQSKQLKRMAPHAEFHAVYYLEHDFDRFTDKPDGRKAYEAALDFLAGVRAGS